MHSIERMACTNERHLLPPDVRQMVMRKLSTSPLRLSPQSASNRQLVPVTAQRLPPIGLKAWYDQSISHKWDEYLTVLPSTHEAWCVVGVKETFFGNRSGMALASGFEFATEVSGGDVLLHALTTDVPAKASDLSICADRLRLR